MFNNVTKQAGKGLKRVINMLGMGYNPILMR